jgi:uncharacterized protein (DUF362 family)/Pyruvate/2-oxoacid:ferredoxin oxidoreductase delta subunit
MKTKVSLVHCPVYDREQVMNAVRQAVDHLGGIRALVKPGEKILLKPNLLSAREPERAVTTHPEVVRAMVRLVKEAGATPIVGDSPGGAVKGVERVWERTGMKKMAEEEGVTLVNFETSGAVEKAITHPLLGSLHLARVLFEVDGIINLPKLKTHSLVIFTGSLKNLYGCVPGLRKAEYHKIVPHPEDFGRLLGELYLLLKDRIRFTLVDGIVGMEGNGPSSGDRRTMEMIVASADAVALDSAVTNLLGFRPDKIEPISYLARKRAGESDLRNIEFAGSPVSSFSLAHFKFPSNWYIKLVPRFLIRALGKLVWMKPEVMPTVCTGCQMCVQSCPVQAIAATSPSGRPLVNRQECISCLCCHEMCTFNAIELRSSFVSRLLIRH